MLSTTSETTQNISLPDVPDAFLAKWQKTVDLMARIYDVPAGLIMRVHSKQIEVFVTSHTPNNPYELGECADLNTGLYCETVMAQRAQLHVPNALEDPLWDKNPDIALNMISYLGVPIEWPNGSVFGTICVLDVKTRHFNATYKDVIWQFKEIVDGDLRFLTELRRREQTEEELRIAKDLAETASRAKGTFLANMSHELRTPLNAILGFVQVMGGNKTLDKENREHLGIIRRSGEHLLNLINNILDLARIDSGRVVLTKNEFHLQQFLDNLEDMFSLRAKDKRLHLSIEYEPEEIPYYVEGDEVKLRQVLINLLNNAIKFTDHGGVLLRVQKDRAYHSNTPSDEEQEHMVYLCFEIEDTGPGIAPDELPKLFQAFVQTSTGQKSYEGTGLGLSITRHFVQLMGGEINVRSTVGQGSVFYFTIPMKEVTSHSSQQKRSVQPVVGIADGQPEYRILVVDDRWTNRHLMIKLLEPLGFVVRDASNGLEAVEIWESWEPQLIWMDMRMPVMDGYEAARRIKSTTKGQATAVVALTASALEEERSIVLSAGCDDFLRKPFRESDIFEMMSRHLGVQYEYAQENLETTDPHISAELEQNVNVETLSTLPTELLAGLEQAVIRTSPDLIEQMIRQIRLHNPGVATVLLKWAEDFDYARILELIQQVQKQEV